MPIKLEQKLYRTEPEITTEGIEHMTDMQKTKIMMLKLLGI